MAAGYNKAIGRLPHADVVFDRFHVARLASVAVDEVRRDEVNKASGARKRDPKRNRYPLLRDPDTLDGRGRATLQRERRPARKSVAPTN